MRDKTRETIINNFRNGVKLTSEQQSWVRDELKRLDALTKENTELKQELNQLKIELTKLELLLSSSLEQTRESINVLSSS